MIGDVKPGAANVLLVIYKPNEGATRYNTAYNPTDINAVGTTRTWKPISNEQILRWNNGNWEIVDVLDPTMPGEIIGNVPDPWNVEANMFNGYAIKAISLE